MAGQHTWTCNKQSQNSTKEAVCNDNAFNVFTCTAWERKSLSKATTVGSAIQTLWGMKLCSIYADFELRDAFLIHLMLTGQKCEFKLSSD